MNREQEAKLWGEDLYRPSAKAARMSLGEIPLHSGSSIPDGLLDGSSRSTVEGGKKLCGSVQCSGAWRMPWRSRRRPIFEGQWGCSGRCVLAMVRAAVRRERQDGAIERKGPHRHRVPLGLVMLAQGWISHPQLQVALDAQKEKGGRIGERLITDCGIESEQVTRGLSVQWSCPVLTAVDFQPQSMALVMPRALVEEFGAVPLRSAGARILYLGLEECLQPSLALALEHMTDLKVESGLMGAAEFASAKERLLASAPVETRSETLADVDALAARLTALIEQSQPVNSRLVRVGGFYWLRMWLENGTLSGTGSLPRSTEDVSDTLFTIGPG